MARRVRVTYLLHFIDPETGQTKPYRAGDVPRADGETTEGSNREIVHYLGKTEDLPRRLHKHRTDPDVRLLQVIKEAGLSFVLARTWPGDVERQLKDRKNAREMCPECGVMPRDPEARKAFGPRARAARRRLERRVAAEVEAWRQAQEQDADRPPPADPAEVQARMQDLVREEAARREALARQAEGEGSQLTPGDSGTVRVVEGRIGPQSPEEARTLAEEMARLDEVQRRWVEEENRQLRESVPGMDPDTLGLEDRGAWLAALREGWAEPEAHGAPLWSDLPPGVEPDWYAGAGAETKPDHVPHPHRDGWETGGGVWRHVPDYDREAG